MRQDHLTTSQLVWLIGYAIAMSAGQLLFKAAAQQLSAAEPYLWARVFALAGNGYFLLAMLLYTGLTIVWVWILTFTPLSYAYPFVALAFGITPLLAAALFGDPISTRLILGCLLVVRGIVIIGR